MSYELIMLIITSGDVPVYRDFERTLSMYHAKYAARVRHFFVEFNPNINENVLESGEYIYVKGVESFKPGIYDKTMAALRYINSKYTYTHVIRTNTSSFWNLGNTLEFQKQLPVVNYIGGIMHGHTFIDLDTKEEICMPFITGTGIFMSRDIAEKISTLRLPNDVVHRDIVTNTIKNGTIPEIFNDDVSISCILSILGHTLQNIGDDKRKLCINDSDSMDDFEYKELYYRIENDNRDIDIKLFHQLFDKLYR